jgi:hypothetical protein
MPPGHVVQHQRNDAIGMLLRRRAEALDSRMDRGVD